MKKNLLFIILCGLFFNSSIAQTNVSGFISANTTWNLAGSPYIIVGNALVSHGYTLTIDPGVVVKFDTGRVLQIDGELIAIGTSANRIIFTSNKTIPAVGDWGKIHFSDTCISAIFDTSGNYISGSIMKYCDVKYGGRLGFGEIHIINSSPYFSHCNISFSSMDGIYSYQKSYTIDSSSINNCTGIGLHLERCFENSCSIIIQDDSLVSNFGGGIKFGSYSYLNCNFNHFTLIRRNVFLSNNKGALSGGDEFDSLIISENIFENNIGNNSSICKFGATTYMIECNKFLNNQSNVSVLATGGDNYDSYSSSFCVQNNTIEGNIVTGNDASIVSITTNSSYRDMFLTNNIIRNNSSVLGQICAIEGSYSMTFRVHFNNIVNNTAKRDISLLASLGTGSNWTYLDLSNNNLVNPNCQYEFYNNVPYGAPNIYVDSNYWGNVSTQHLDSVINDFFDNGNLSVVYYSPFLTTPVLIDTSCRAITTAISQIEKPNFNSTIFPNPFSQQATIRFEKELHHVTFNLYNLFGQVVQSKNNISGKEIILNRENLHSGIYIYEVTDQEKRICAGKAVIY